MKTDGSAAAGILIPAGDTIRIPWSFDADGSHLAFYQRGTRGSGSVTLTSDGASHDRPRFDDGRRAEAVPRLGYLRSVSGVLARRTLDRLHVVGSGAYEIYVSRSRTEDTSGKSQHMVERWQRGHGTAAVCSTRRRTSASWLSTGASATAYLSPLSPDSGQNTARRRGLAPSFDVAPDGRVAALLRTAIGKPAACESCHVGVELVRGIAPPRAPLNGHTGSQTVIIPTPPPRRARGRSLSQDRFRRRLTMPLPSPASGSVGSNWRKSGPPSPSR